MGGKELGMMAKSQQIASQASKPIEDRRQSLQQAQATIAEQKRLIATLEKRNKELERELSAYRTKLQAAASKKQ